MSLIGESNNQLSINMEATPNARISAQSDASDIRKLSIQTDSDEDEKNDFTYAFGWNIEQLYHEILYEIIHNIGSVGTDLNEKSLFAYVQDAFKITDDVHSKALQAARDKEPPAIRLDVEVIEAIDLQSKDSNGLSDPFVTMYLASNPEQRFNTTVKQETLNPVWEEHFSVPLAENHMEEHLVVEVWDFDRVEPVKGKVSQILDVKSVKGLRKLMKEIAIIVSTGKDFKELIGRASIPLKSIPSSGLEMWYSLSKKNKIKNLGTVKLKLNFSAEKNSLVCNTEHRRLVRILLRHELETSKVAHYWWSGKFSSLAEAVLTQHVKQCGLSTVEVSLIQWAVYTSVHIENPLSFALFDNLLEKLVKSIQVKSLQVEDLGIFWGSTTKFLSTCLLEIKRLKNKSDNDKNISKTLTDVLNIISKISILEPPEGIELLPTQDYEWLQCGNPKEKISAMMMKSVTAAGVEWFQNLNDLDKNRTIEEKINDMIQMVEVLMTDVHKSMETYDQIFQEKINLQYSKTLYTAYRAELMESFGSVIMEMCDKLPPLNLPDDLSTKVEENKDIKTGTALFKLYLTLKQFFRMRLTWITDQDDETVDEYHAWFSIGINHWLDLSTYKAFISIQKAIDLDHLHPVDNTVKYSSSAVDILGILHQFKIFWEQLTWPNIEGTCKVARKVADVINLCCEFYAVQLTRFVDDPDNNSVYEITRKKCFIINNIDHLNVNLIAFASNFKFNEAEVHMKARQCSETLKTVIIGKIDKQRNKNLQILECISNKMAPTIKRLMMQGGENIIEGVTSMDILMVYLEDSLTTLNSNLAEEYFDQILEFIWDKISSIFNDYVQLNIFNHKPTIFFSNLLTTLQMMKNHFNSPESSRENLDHLEKLLRLHGCETNGLILEYYKNRLIEQQKLTETPFGILTVQCCFRGNNLEINVLSARNLKPIDETCDSFVRIHLIPESKFTNVVQPKTQTKKKDLFPLYDEKFSIPLTPEQRSFKDAIILFSLNDKKLFGIANQYLAECYLSFAELMDVKSNNNSEKVPQMHLKLSRPYKPENFTTYSTREEEFINISSTDYFHALENRQNDKEAKDFVRKISKG